MARRKSQIVGVPRLRRLLSRIDPALRAEIPVALRQTGLEMLEDMRSNVPRSDDPPHIGDALDMRVLRNELAAEVGLLRRADRRRFFYWKFLEYGTVNMTAQPFANSAVLRAEKNYPSRIRAAVDAALRRAASG